MGTFDDILGASQTIFSNPDALDPDFVPKLLPHREDQQRYIVTCIKPLFFGQNGKHLLIKGVSGIGKTACVKRVLMDLEEETEEIIPIYVNCWSKNTTYKVLAGVANAMGYKFTHNMNTDEIMTKISELAAKYKGVVYVFDEIDKADEHDFLYSLLEDHTKKTIIMMTSDFQWASELDSRITSRLLPDSVTFNPYNFGETAKILQERIKYAFYQGVWSEEAFAKLASHAAKFKDIRVGIVLLKSAGMAAEDDSSKKVLVRHSEKAISQIDGIKIKASSDVTDEEKAILELCKNNDGVLVGDLYSVYASQGGEKSDKTFRRKLARLANRKLIELEGASGQGQGTVVSYRGFERTLDEFTK